MALFVLAYPNFTEKDYNLIQEYRKKNDMFFKFGIEPHFTFVFPITNMEEKDFVTEITKQAKGIQKVFFTICGANTNKDALSEYYNTFLIPDDGNAQLIKLHNKLYDDKLSFDLNLDIDFIPHITVGNSKSKLNCKLQADEWNEKEFRIYAYITTLTIAKLDGNKLTTIAEIELN